MDRKSWMIASAALAAMPVVSLAQTVTDPSLILTTHDSGYAAFQPMPSADCTA